MSSIGAPAVSALARAIASWRIHHERRIVDELIALVAIPNIPENDADMRRNADRLEDLFVRRGFSVESTSGPGSPVVLATLDVPDARGTLILYLHYDGQPVDPLDWSRCPPFEPRIYDGADPIPLDASRTTFDPSWRIYGRSVADDKGPIVAVLGAIDALRAVGGGPAWNLRVVLDGEEEVGSAAFRRFAQEGGHGLDGDIAIMLDGPRHPSGRPTVYFGVRGDTGLTLRVYGARSDLHSGNYGSWGPDPSIRLARLLASMKDEEGTVTIAGFHDDVTPLTTAEEAALDEIPDIETDLRHDFLVARPDRPDERIERKHCQPTLSVQAIGSGGGLDAPARSAIPASAAARIEMRLVPGLDPAAQNRLVVEHVRAAGYLVIDGRDPTDDERLAYPLIARVDLREGSAAPRVSMDDPMARSVVAALIRDGRELVRLPTLGGGMPFATFSTVLRIPTIGLAIVNHDNAQHGPDENLRLGNLWEGIEVIAAIMTMPR